LELATGDDTLRELWLDLFNRFRLSARLAPRKGVSVVYLKEAERISRALTLMGAGAARCEYENARIIKDMRNQANRAANCDNANTDKAIDAAQRQIEAIELLERTVGLSTLPDPLFDAAKKRLEHPELSLADLWRSLQPPVGKSGANHRVKRIEEIARHGDISREVGINDDTTE
jgi:DNA-binding protein WhiA